MKPCPKCGEQIKETLKFCVHCGCNIAQEEAKTKAKFCGECGAQIEDGMKFCGECGAKVESASPSKQNDDPWAEVLDEQKNDDPWANFADSEQQEETEEEPQVDLQQIQADYNKGVDLYWKQQYSSALPLLLPAAQQGNAEAQAQVGYCHLCMQKYDEAYQWFCKASEQGVVWAYDNIGWMYEKGLGVKQDYFLAYSNYKTAADLGSVFSCANAGWLLQNGWGVVQDYAKSFDYWLKAAQMGHAGAQNSVGVFYKNGWGVAQDQEKAAEWFVRALQNGETQYAATNLYYVSNNFFAGICGAEKSEKRAFELGLISAQYNCADAMEHVRNCYEFGWGTECDLKQAKYWYQKALDAGKDVADKLERVNKELSK